MPWNIQDVDRFKSGLTQEQKQQWVEIANSALQDCLNNGGSQEDCEASAIRQANGVVGNMQTHTFQANVAQGVRRERFDGRDHLVVPVVALREGVLNGFYVPRQEIQRSAPAWNGVPIPIGHPMQNGRPITANSPQQLEQSNLGRFFNVQAQGDKLKGEMWIDIARAEQLGRQDLVNNLENGEQNEVSTAYFSDDEFVQGNAQGRQYNAISRNLRPDHLALLPNETGACSWADGCGAPRTHQDKGEDKMSDENQNKDQGLNQNEGQEEHTQEQETKGISFVQKVLHALGLRSNQEEVGYEQIVDSLRMTVDSWDSEFAIHFLVEVFDDYFIYKKRDRQTNQTRLLRCGYIIGENGTVQISEEEPQEVRQEISYVTIQNNREVNVMNKEQMVDKLIANSATQFTKDDREMLQNMDECTLQKLEPVQEEPKGNQDEGKQNQTQSQGETVTINKEDLQQTVAEMVQNEMQKSEKQKIVDRLKQNENCEWSDEDLMAMSEDGLKKLESTLTPGDYSGRGGPRAHKGEDDVPAMPELFPAETKVQ